MLAGAAPVGLVPLLRSVFLVARPDLPGAASWPIVNDVANRFYVKPEGDGLLCSPADETPVAPGTPRPDELASRRPSTTSPRTRCCSPGIVTTTWAGLRVFAPDRVPVVGFDPERAGLFWLAGQGGFGIQTAPALARLAAALVRGEDLPADIAALGLAVQALHPGRTRGYSR